MEYVSHYESPLGRITLVSDGEALIGLWFDKQKHYDGAIYDAQAEKELPVFDQTKKWLDIYFGGKEPGFTPLLKMKTTPFRRTVWEVMLSIPYGQTTTYGQIARYVAEQKGMKQMSAQAVGGAVGHNSISIIIPCHRVVGTNSSLTGYGGGIDRKIKLLTLEGVDMGKLFVPKNGTAT